MAYEEGQRAESILHESGEDILVSYRTGRTAIIKDGKIEEIIKAGKNYQKVSWKRSEWEEQDQKEKEKAEQIEATERDQKQLASLNK